METITRFQPLYGKTAAAPTCSRSRWGQGVPLVSPGPSQHSGGQHPEGSRDLCSAVGRGCLHPPHPGQSGDVGTQPRGRSGSLTGGSIPVTALGSAPGRAPTLGITTPQEKAF